MPTLNDQPSADTATVATATPEPDACSGPQARVEAQAQADTGRPGAGPGGLRTRGGPARLRPAAPAALAAGTALLGDDRRRDPLRKNKVGDQVTATVARTSRTHRSGGDPAGSKVTLQVTAISASDNKSDTTGTLTLKPVSIAINGQTAADRRPRSRA